jgi:hypothetical protein
LSTCGFVEKNNRILVPTIETIAMRSNQCCNLPKQASRLYEYVQMGQESEDQMLKSYYLEKGSSMFKLKSYLNTSLGTHHLVQRRYNSGEDLGNRCRQGVCN